jgi:MoxR-like ATPase
MDPERRLALGDDRTIEAANRRQVADVLDVYVLHDDKLRLAVDVALVTRRALLLEGPSGSGKSALAEAVALHLGWRFYRQVITSRIQARDLLWEVDHVRRLADSQAGRFQPDVAHYVRPGPMWWAFDPESASTLRGRRSALSDPSTHGDPDQPAVLLLDEIDKADADMPNDLLVPLGSMEFQVDVLDDRPDGAPTVTDAEPGNGGEESTAEGFRVVAEPGREPLVVITSNLERDLSPAFLRRCVRYRLGLPPKVVYVEIASATVAEARPELINRLADALVPDTLPEAERASIATFIDAVRAAVELDPDLDTPQGQLLIDVFQRWRLGDFPSGPAGSP